jgi:hypothetical protein
MRIKILYYPNIPMNTTLILTSTVNVNYRKSFLHQKDKHERLDVYLKSIRQWLDKSNFNIIVVDNSGYRYDELSEEKAKYENRFEVVSFVESEVEEAKYLEGNTSKGASEMFAIYYAFRHTRIIQPHHFIIKITARYFIPELEEYLSGYDLSTYDSLTQENRDRCEMVGCHYNKFTSIFKPYLITSGGWYDGHVENIWKERTSMCDNILVCKKFAIERTQRGGLNETFDNI